MKILASSVFNKYKTRDPFEIAKQKDIFIIGEPLGNIQGYYENKLNQKFIHVNDSLPTYYQKYVVAYMLYKVFTNPNETLLLKRKEELKFTDAEFKASKFAINLIFTEEELKNVRLLVN